MICLDFVESRQSRGFSTKSEDPRWDRDFEFRSDDSRLLPEISDFEFNKKGQILNLSYLRKKELPLPAIVMRHCWSVMSMTPHPNSSPRQWLQPLFIVRTIWIVLPIRRRNLRPRIVVNIGGTVGIIVLPVGIIVRVIIGSIAVVAGA